LVIQNKLYTEVSNYIVIDHGIRRRNNKGNNVYIIKEVTIQKNYSALKSGYTVAVNSVLKTLNH
jgi:hypothetical protein